jgi:hypothetical protein
MSRKKLISTELSVGLTPELERLVEFASENSLINPSLFGRIAIAEKLHRDNWHQIYLAAQQNKQALGAK